MKRLTMGAALVAGLLLLSSPAFAPPRPDPLMIIDEKLDQIIAALTGTDAVVSGIDEDVTSIDGKLDDLGIRVEAIQGAVGPTFSDGPILGSPSGNFGRDIPETDGKAFVLIASVRCEFDASDPSNSIIFRVNRGAGVFGGDPFSIRTEKDSTFVTLATGLLVGFDTEGTGGANATYSVFCGSAVGSEGSLTEHLATDVIAFGWTTGE